MPSLLLATEAHEGMGHVAPWTGFVTQAMGRGCEMHMAAPDAGLLHAQIAQHHPVHVWVSPRLSSPHPAERARPSVTSWPELMVSLGYAHPHALQGAVMAWRSMLSRVRPALVLADYAPALLLAAWTLDIPSLEVGHGFCVPPWGPPLQNFPGIKHPHATQLAQADAQLTRAFNECLTQFGKAPITSVCEVQAWPAARLVMSPPELDCYAPRTDVVHAGLLQPDAQAPDGEAANDWPAVVGYLKSNTPGLDSLVGQMAQARVDALIYVPGAEPEKYGAHGTVTLTDRALPLSTALQHALVYLSNGGLSGVGQALQAGCWPVIVPQQAEQVATTRNLLRRGWCGMWLPDAAHSTEQSTQALFAARPRHARLSGADRGETVLWQTIERLISRAASAA